jgi:tartrate-resistant acid phosphatase type 5
VLQNLTSALETSNAKWKIVVGHHTMRCVGKHGETQELFAQMLPILEVSITSLF